MTKRLRWIVKLICWISIFFFTSWGFNGKIPVWAYFVMVALFVAVNFAVNRLIEDYDE